MESQLTAPVMYVTKRDGRKEPRDVRKIQRAVAWMCNGLNVSQSDLETSVHLPLYDGVTTADIQRTLVVEAATKISPGQPDWTYVAARGLLQYLYKHANSGAIEYPHLSTYLQRGTDIAKLDPKLVDPEWFDLDVLNAGIRPERDLTLDYLGLQTLVDRYFVRDDEDTIIELPQWFFMRVAMGIALRETTRDARTSWALAYYEMYSNAEALSSTPTLFNSGTRFPQLSSCFGQTYGDDTDQIMDGLKESANYSKYSGGVSIDIGGIRCTGSRIRSTGGKAGGPIPYLKLYNGVMIGFDQSGKRKGSGAAYIEPWHPDVFKFLDLREAGDDRFRAHDIFPAMWIPDLFLKRVEADGKWSFIDPKTCPELHEKWGDEFEELYIAAEERGLAVETVRAQDLWSRMLERLFTYGVFWPCFKDTANARYPQPEVVHNSNLCTEIILRTDSDTSFVCNLASTNVGHDKHLLTKGADGKYQWNTALEATVRKLVRNLDSVIDIGFVPHANGRRFQEQDRAIGLGCMGWADALAKMGVDYESAAHVEYASEVWRQMSLTAVDESANLAAEFGSYPQFSKSTWADGLLPVDTLRHRRVVDKFGLDLNCDTPFATGDELRAKVKRGMRNSCLMAIAPTATIANILGVSQCTELPWQLGYRKKNLSGEFKVFATTLLNNRKGIPLKTARQVDQKWTVWAAAARQIWIDQSQSTNFFLNPDTPLDQIGEMIDDLYFEAWRCGLKTTYYFYAKAEDSDAITLSQVQQVQQQAPVQPQLFNAAGDTAVYASVATGVSLSFVTGGASALVPGPLSMIESAGNDWTGGRVCDINAGPDCESCQ